MLVDALMHFFAFPPNAVPYKPGGEGVTVERDFKKWHDCNCVIIYADRMLLGKKVD